MVELEVENPLKPTKIKKSQGNSEEQVLDLFFVANSEVDFFLVVVAPFF